MKWKVVGKAGFTIFQRHRTGRMTLMVRALRNGAPTTAHVILYRLGDINMRVEVSQNLTDVAFETISALFDKAGNIIQDNGEDQKFTAFVEDCFGDLVASKLWGILR